jgi:epoxyqueuosine reductase
MSTTSALKARARAAGFDAIGIARAAALDRDGEALAAWLRHDGHASMAWMAKDPARRADPRALVAGATSVVALAMSYWPGRERAAVKPGAAQVALYARGRDYHKVMGRKLRDLAAWLAEETGHESRAFVDTAPILERAWAERAGVGWIGKNANLLTREGSWLLLGEIVTAADLVPDAGPHADFCGTCTACLDGCPTGAIVEPGVVDSHRCISYWTIEHRGSIPEERRAGLADWIFGCDVCQTVCPWNESFAAPRADDPFAWRDDLRGLDPVEVLEMEENTFRERFSGTALMRARWDGMRRNACLVLGNRRDPAAIGPLRRALDDADPVIRDSAAWALQKIEESRAG